MSKITIPKSATEVAILERALNAMSIACDLQQKELDRLQYENGELRTRLADLTQRGVVNDE